MSKAQRSPAKAILAAALVAGVVAGIFWISYPPPAPSAIEADSATATPDLPATPTTTASGGPSAPPVAPNPLPSLIVPFALIADDLKARSKAGDPDAACRLAAEWSYCRQHDLQRADFDRWLSERQTALGLITDPAARQTTAANIDREMTFRENILDQLAHHCADVPTASPDEIAQQWRRAALLGNPAAMKQYASGNAFRWGSLLDSLPLLASFRGEAEAIALRVAQTGDAEMMLALAAGYDPQPTTHRSLLGQTLRPDAARAVALYRRVQSGLDALPQDGRARAYRRQLDRYKALESLLTPAERERMQHFTEQDMATWSAPVFDESRPANGGGQADVSRFACGAPPGETRRRRAVPAQ